MHPRKIKVTKRPAYDSNKLMELHAEHLEREKSPAAMEVNGKVTLGGAEPPILPSV